MVLVAIVTIGSELVSGRAVDTNAAWLSREATLLGRSVTRHISVEDDVGAICGALRDSAAVADVVITTGGLGPTHDDVTREAIAQFLGVDLEYREDLAAKIRDKFAAAGKPMAESNLAQAFMPVGTRQLGELVGTAPGISAITDNGLPVYCLPGVPFEAREMFQKNIAPTLVSRVKSSEMVIKLWGLSEAVVAERSAGYIAEAKGLGVDVGLLASDSTGIKFVLSGAAPDTETAASKIVAEFSDYVFATCEGDTIESITIEALRKSGLKVGVAESVTGGLVASRFTSVSGASDVFNGGVVAYARLVKETVLNVSTELLVTENAAVQMAQGAKKLLAADIAVATTGVAGPQSVEGQPVGTVCFASVGPGGIRSLTARFVNADRSHITSLASVTAIDMVRREALGIGVPSGYLM